LLSILRIFCMRGFLPPPADPPWLYASVSGLLCARSGHCWHQNVLINRERSNFQFTLTVDEDISLPAPNYVGVPQS
ncbi:hypothetical protein ACSG0J_001807, partial [Escherichia coli]